MFFIQLKATIKTTLTTIQTNHTVEWSFCQKFKSILETDVHGRSGTTEILETNYAASG
jgi:hypothetical protein